MFQFVRAYHNSVPGVGRFVGGWSWGERTSRLGVYICYGVQHSARLVQTRNWQVINRQSRNHHHRSAVLYTIYAFAHNQRIVQHVTQSKSPPYTQSKRHIYIHTRYTMYARDFSSPSVKNHTCYILVGRAQSRLVCSIGTARYTA